MNPLRETICLKRYSPSNYEKNATVFYAALSMLRGTL